MLDGDIGYGMVAVNKAKLSRLKNKVEQEKILCHRFAEAYNELANKAAAKEDALVKLYWTGVIDAAQDAIEMMDRISEAVQALTEEGEGDQEKEVPSAKDTHSKNHQPHYTTSAS